MPTSLDPSFKDLPPLLSGAVLSFGNRFPFNVDIRFQKAAFPSCKLAVVSFSASR